MLRGGAFRALLPRLLTISSCYPFGVVFTGHALPKLLDP